MDIWQNSDRGPAHQGLYRQNADIIHHQNGRWNHNTNVWMVEISLLAIVLSHTISLPYITVCLKSSEWNVQLPKQYLCKVIYLMFPGFSLPPTPPSSTTSDSEGNVSPDHNPSSPSRHMRQQHNGTTRLLVPSNSTTPSASNRQPIQTPLISNQPVSVEFSGP